MKTEAFLLGKEKGGTTIFTKGNRKLHEKEARGINLRFPDLQTVIRTKKDFQYGGKGGG